ncbi:hypothetical protein LSTR_LSTR005656 [Laodelphax striatellus]|uniref:Hsp90 co-chaperone Cdc37 n=1 Tax=Laodelphax striatellus TaxID=195883 RepID=A0A482WUZ0_LAOST|nr:hypothetical protein LSTR_LSTR005656 [Laodelphax striatellus]
MESICVLSVSMFQLLQISDDEDETHPNVDTPSLFRMRHRARIERMEKHQREKEEFEKLKQVNKQKILSTKKKILETEKQGGDVTELRKALDQLKVEAENLKEQEKDLSQKEKVTPWNVDTISKPGFSRTVVNKKPEKKPEEENVTDAEWEERMEVFIKENEKIVMKFGMLQKYNDSKQYLLEHPHLVCEDTASYLVIWSIKLEMEEKTNLVRHIAHQSVCITFILKLSKQLEVDPRACVDAFFSKIQVADPEFKQVFNEEVEALIERVQKCAKEKVFKMAMEQEELRLGPGALDPFQVYQSLPDSLKACLLSQNTALLHKTLEKLPAEDAIYHMQRLMDSGLLAPKAEHKAATTTAADDAISSSSVKKVD